MRSGGLGDQINPWGLELFKTILSTEPTTDARGVGVRPVARPDVRPRAGTTRPGPRRRGHHPVPLWIVLFLIAVLIFVFMLFFADPAERSGRAGAPMVSVDRA